MKTIVLLAMLSLSSAAFSQDTLTYAMTQDIEYAKTIKNGTEYKVYVSKDGTIFNIGDTLKINEPKGAVATNGTRYASTTFRLFQYIYLGHYTLGKAILNGKQPLTDQNKNEACIIEAFRVQHSKGSKESILLPMVYLVNPNVARVLGKNNRTVYNFELALEVNEVSNPKRIMSRTEAIAKLKESKDLVDLGIMKPEEYDALKTKLTPIITQQ